MIGIFLDTTQIIVITDKGEAMEEIMSKAEKQPRRSGDSTSQGFL
jgi:hypothetical protein